MRCFKINPELKTITEDNAPEGIEARVSFLRRVVDGTFAVGHEIERGEKIDTVYVDDEFLLKAPQFFFKFPDSEILSGNAVVLGTDMETGDSIDANISLEDLRKLVTWYSKPEVISLIKEGRL